MKVMNVAIAFLAIATIVLIFADNLGIDAMLAPSTYKTAASGIAPSALRAPACSYQDITTNILSRLPVANNQLLALEKIQDSYYMIRTNNGFFIYYLGGDGLIATNDDSAYQLGPSIYRWEMTENGGGVRLFYYDLVPTINGYEIHACILTPIGCLNDVIVTSVNTYLIETMVPSDSQNRLYLFLRNPSRSVSGIFSCSLTGGNDDCALGQPSFTYELFTRYYSASVPDTGIFHFDPLLQENFFDINARASIRLPVTDIILRRNVLDWAYPLIYAIRNTVTGFGANSITPELVMLDVAAKTVTTLETVAPPSSLGVGVFAVDMDASIQNKPVSIFASNGYYFGKRYMSPSVQLLPFSSTLIFSPIDVIPDKTVVGYMYPTGSPTPPNSIFRFTCTP